MIINNKKIQDRDAGKSVDGAQYAGQVYAERRHISFYDEPPQDIIGIYEFQKTAVNRLQVLKRIQFLYDSNKDGDRDLMLQEINKYSRQHELNIEGGAYDKGLNKFGKIPATQLR